MASKSATTDSRILFAKQMSIMNQKAEQFSAAVVRFDALRESELTELGLQVDSKKRALSEIDQDVEQKVKRGRIDVETQLAEHRWRTALDILTERSMVPVDVNEIATLRADMDRLSTESAEQVRQMQTQLEEGISAAQAETKQGIAQTIAVEKAKAKKTLDSALHVAHLEAEAKTAQLEAGQEQAGREIAVLKETINNLKVELAETRKVITQVASAAGARPIQLMTGDSGRR